MPRYENHRTKDDKIKITKAIKDYNLGKKTQKECCDDNDIKLSVFRYYYNRKEDIDVIDIKNFTQIKDVSYTQIKDISELFKKKNNKKDKWFDDMFKKSKNITNIKEKKRLLSVKENAYTKINYKDYLTTHVPINSD